MDILLQEYNSEARNFTEARHCCEGLVVLKCESTTGPHKGSLAHWKGLLLISLEYNKRRSRLDLQSASLFSLSCRGFLSEQSRTIKGTHV